jgi:hypothetical protein
MNLICLFPTNAGTRQVGGIGLDIILEPITRVQINEYFLAFWHAATQIVLEKALISMRIPID